MLLKRVLLETDLMVLISERKWKDVSQFVRRNDFCADLNMINFALCYNPPLYIVQRIFENSPDEEFEKDAIDRYPLSNAIICGSNSDVIRYLIQLNGKAIKSVDKQGKTPLHHLFEYFKKAHDIDEYKEIIHLLCLYGPGSILKEDFEGRNVIEHAI